MKGITREMLKIYVPESNLDWMNYKLVKKQLTFHHIVKKSEGGLYTIDNGALLNRISHDYLNVIEYSDHKTYEALNRIFKIVNNQRYEPDKEQREIIEYLLREYEYKHREDTTKKGKRLIKKEYLDRW